MAINHHLQSKVQSGRRRSQRAAAKGPVFITDRGHRRPMSSLTIEQYQKLTGKTENIVDLIAMPRASKIDFEPPKLKGRLYRPADFD